MSDYALEQPPRPDVSHLVTEDDEPVDNLFSEKLQRLLASALYASWSGPPHLPANDDESPECGPRRFLVAANVGIFMRPQDTPIVPDVLLSTDVALEELSWTDEERRAYFVWEMGKVPELVIEIVSNRKGDELTRKLRHYSRLHVSAYVVFDPRQLLGEEIVRVFTLQGDLLRPVPPTSPPLFEHLGLGLTLWKGSFEGTRSTWLRFTDAAGELLLTGEERADQERQRADKEGQRADQERQRADQEQAAKEAALARIAELEATLKSQR